jgi:hypothetical protein
MTYNIVIYAVIKSLFSIGRRLLSGYSPILLPTSSSLWYWVDRGSGVEFGIVETWNNGGNCIVGNINRIGMSNWENGSWT